MKANKLKFNPYNVEVLLADLGQAHSVCGAAVVLPLKSQLCGLKVLFRLSTIVRATSIFYG